MGHAARSCAIGMRLAAVIGLPSPERSALFYAAPAQGRRLLRELLPGRRALRRRRRRGQARPQDARPAPPGRAGRPPAPHGRAGRGADRQGRPDQGARAQRRGGLAPADRACAASAGPTSRGWSAWGRAPPWPSGRSTSTGTAAAGPTGCAATTIPLLGRILCLSQTVEVFHARDGAHAACAMARDRAGTWFDPELVQALGTFEADRGFWERLLRDDEPALGVGDFEPEDLQGIADDERLDSIAEAFAKIIDAKSPFTFRHSEGVAELSVGIADQLGYSPRARRGPAAGRAAARRGQARGLQPDPRQAGQARRRRVAPDAPASRAHLPHPQPGDRLPAPRRRSPPPTTRSSTARATTSACRPSSSRPRRGSSPSPTSARRSPPTARTAVPSRSRRSCPSSPRTCRTSSTRSAMPPCRHISAWPEAV